jgi:hypothetical protein
MKPIVNVDVKMTKKMLNALTLFETYCLASNITLVTIDFVNEFLTKRFNESIAKQFKTEYLYQ